MSIRFASAAIAAVFITGSLAADAFADHRRWHRVRPYDRYYAGPEVVQVPGVLRLMFGGYRMSPEAYDEIYGSDDFDESYYDPQIDEPVKKLKPRKTVKPAAAKLVTPALKPKKDVATASIAKPAAAAKSVMTCDKATSIVGDYGFSSVKPSDCQGEVYAFNATRDGKSFAIKLNAASGELTEVKKLQ